MGRLEQKVAVITGGGGGLGRSAAECFAREGARVVVCGRRVEPLQETVELIEAAGGTATAVTGDISIVEDADRIVRATVDAYGCVDILVNNAALLMSSRETSVGSMGTTQEATAEDFDQVIDVNLRGVFVMCKRVLPLMKEQGSGAILNVASTAAVQGYPNSHHYSASKGGMSALSKSLAVTYGGYGIRVNTLITGGFESPGTADLMPLFAPLFQDPQLRYLWCPMGRLATSDEIAPTMAFLCSDEASYVHGADVAVDGGQSINAVPNFGPRLPAAPLFPEDLLTAATAETGLEDFGDRSFVEGLTVLCDSLRDEGRLNRMGHMIAGSDMARMLVNRLRFVRDTGRHPEILDEELVPPIVILGLPRTGTSKLQRTMSADPEVQRLDVWRLLNPAPFPGEEPGIPQGRIDAGLVAERMLAQMFPDFMAKHPTEALEPDEELLLMEHSFSCDVSSLRQRAPSHRAYAAQRGQHDTYAYMKAMLQYLQWQDGGARGRPWIMKSPVHIGYLETLLEHFPGATVVHCHRDPREVIASYASLTESAWRMGSDAPDPLEIGADVLEYWASAMDRNLEAREHVDTSRILDVPYERIRDDVAGVIGEIYALAGRALTADAEAAFAAYANRRPQGHFGRHDYEAARFGLDAEQIDERFARYRERFVDAGVVA